jgi:glucose-1-phosphate cytidylyltransferase
MTTNLLPPVAILCGGRGTRLRERTREIPKPLVEIGGRPIVQHVIELYAAQGFRRFLLATGYRGELIERFAAAHSWPEGVHVQCVDTGLDTPTGGRIKLLCDPARGAGGSIDFLGPLRAGTPRARGGTFCVTYADGLADIDLARLLAFHEDHGALATMTVVRPELQFGVAELDGPDGRVLGFREKPRSEHWVNGGFFCLRMDALEHLEHDSVLEREPLQRLAAADELRAYRHEGFWECMDTYKDAVALNDLWASGAAPWRSPLEASDRARRITPHDRPRHRPRP